MPGPRMGGPRGFLTEEEKATAPKVTKKLIFRVFSYLRPYVPQLLLVGLTIMVSAVVGLLPSIITGHIVDDALVGQDLGLLIRLLLAALAALLASQLIGVLESYINSWISQQIIFDMKNEMYQHLQYMPHAFFTTEKQGDIITRMNTDISGVSSVISGTLASIVSNTATIVTTIVALITMSVPLAVVGIIILPFLIFPTRSAGKKRYTFATESQARNDEMNEMINETLSVSGSMLVKLFTREEKEYGRFVEINREAAACAVKEARSGKWFMAVMSMFTQVGPLLIYFAGGLIIIRRIDPLLSVGTVTAAVQLINRLYRPVESLLNIQVDFTRSLALFNRIFDYLDREITIKNAYDPQRPELVNADIEYRHVRFGYDPDQIILSDVSFRVPGGKMYAIVGPSGSGKSTIVNLLPRLYDVLDGMVAIADTDVRQIDLTWLRQHIGMVTQDTYLFNGTIMDNLLYAREDATREDVEQACRIANIHDFITAQPDGYDTIVGNRGLKLSGGEKQRISIARVILKDPAILILDEATSALDSISENAIQSALEHLMEGRTSIVIAHRLSTILKADRILVISDGMIREQGSHEELIASGGIYKELYETQFRPALEYEEQKTKETFACAALSSDYTARRLTEADIADVYLLCRSNRRYYRMLHVKPSLRNLTEVISEIPEDVYQLGAGAAALPALADAERRTEAASPSAVGGTAAETNTSTASEYSQKYFIGFYDGDGELVAVLDLILGWPQDDDAFIGWFLVDADRQNRGVGSQLFADIRAALKAQGYDHLSLGCIRENEDAARFWQDQGFVFSGSEYERNGHTVRLMERDI